MDKLKQKSIERKENSLKTDSKKNEKTVSRSAIVGTLIGTLIASTPVLFSLHESVPDKQIWNTFLFTYDSKLWESAQYAMWVYTGKLIPLMLLLIWFFTNRHWWYHALLVPIIMYIFQILVTFYTEKNIDEFQIIYMLPVMAVVIPSIYLIKAKMFNKINNAGKTMQELEEEFMMKPKGVWGTIKQYF